MVQWVHSRVQNALMFNEILGLEASRSRLAWAIVLGAAVMCLGGPWTFATPDGIPLTLQSLLVLLVPLIAGWQVGLSAVLLYLFAGGLGLPVFAQGASGWQHFTGLSGGYLMGFPIAALLVGWAAQSIERYQALWSLLLMVVGHLVVVALGLFWQQAVAPVELETTRILQSFLPGILIKSSAGSFVVALIARTLNKN
jgi:biotin transport system substrate-specific component